MHAFLCATLAALTLLVPVVGHTQDGGAVAVVDAGNVLVLEGPTYIKAGPAVVAVPDAATPSFTAPALTISPIDPEKNFREVLRLGFEAIRDRNWAMLAALLVFMLVWAMRKFGASNVPFLATKLGGIVLTLATGLSGSVLAAVMAGQSITPDLIVRGIWIGVTAAGGWSIVKNFVEHVKGV